MVAALANSSSTFKPRLFLVPEIFIPDVYGMNRLNGVDLKCQFLEGVS